jgi:hypothetical protein
MQPTSNRRETAAKQMTRIPRVPAAETKPSLYAQESALQRKNDKELSLLGPVKRRRRGDLSANDAQRFNRFRHRLFADNSAAH